MLFLPHKIRKDAGRGEYPKVSSFFTSTKFLRTVSPACKVEQLKGPLADVFQDAVLKLLLKARGSR
jgi:hypothetical protein